MATYRDFLDGGIAAGLTKSQLGNAIVDYRENIGEFDIPLPEPNAGRAAKIASKNMMNLLTDDKKKVVAELMSEDDQAFQQTKVYYNMLDGKNYNDFEAKYRMEDNYPEMSPSQILNEINKVQLYDPWEAIKKDRSIRLGEGLSLSMGALRRGFVSGTAGMGAMAGKVNEFSMWAHNKLGTPMARLKPKEPTGRLVNSAWAWKAYDRKRKEYDYDVLTKGDTSVPYDVGMKKLKEFNEFRFKAWMNTAREVEEGVSGDVPDYIKVTIPGKVWSATSEVPMIVASAVFPPFIAGRYYAEGLEESGGDHRVAAGYTALFGTIGWAIDRYTVGAGSKAFKALGKGKRGKLVMKQLKRVGLESQISGGSELITEFAESASLQAVTKGEVNWPQAIEEGLLAYVVGSGTATGAGITRVSKANLGKRVSQLTKEGFTEEESVIYVDRVNDGDVDGANRMGRNMVYNKLALFGDSVMPVIDPTSNLDVPIRFLPYTAGRLRDIRKMTDPKIKELIERTLPKEYQAEAIEAMLSPNEENLGNLNTAIAQYFLSEMRVNRESSLDEEASPSDGEPEVTGQVEPAVDEIITDFPRDPAVFRVDDEGHYKDRSIEDLADMMSDFLSTGTPIPGELVNEAAESFEYAEDLDFFFDEVRRRSERKRRERAKKNSLTPLEEIKYSERAQQMIDEAMTIFGDAVWGASQNVESGDVNPIKYRSMWHNLVGKKVEMGDITGVLAVLNDKGIDPNSRLYKEFIRATEAGQRAQQLHHVENAGGSNNQAPEQEASPDEIPFDDGAKPEPENDTVIRLLEEAEAIADDIFERLSVGDLGLTSEESELFMRYVGYKQDYDESLDPVDISELPQRAREFLARWEVVSKDLAEKIEAIKDLVGLDFNVVSGLYFPLRHKPGGKGDIITVADLFAASTGFAKSRSGTFSGVVLDPVWQVEQTVNEVSRILAIAGHKVRLIEEVRSRSVHIARAMEKKANGEELNDADKAALDKFNELVIVDEKGAQEGMDRSPEAQSRHYSRILLYAKDGDGADLPSLDFTVIKNEKLRQWLVERGGDWANFVDPHFIVQKMDLTGEVKEGGRMYGANARLWQLVIQGARLAKEANVRIRKQQVEVLKSYDTRKKLKRINTLLSDLFFSDANERTTIFRAKDPGRLQSALGLSAEDANTVFYYGQIILELRADMGRGARIRSNLSEISAEGRVRFSELELKIKSGVYTSKEMLEYESYAPSADENTKKNIARNMARAVFERQAIDAKDFFGYFDSLSNSAHKGGYLYDLTNEIESWAAHLDSIGQPSNARWWRMKVESNIKGNLFEFEDSILDYVAGAIKKTTSVSVGDDLTGSFLDPLRGVPSEQIKAGIVTAMGTLQKARIHGLLLGNIGWSLTTQPSSLAFTIKQAGLRRTVKAMYSALHGDVNFSESDVVSLKGMDHTLGGVESTDQFTEFSGSKTARHKLRDYMGWLGGVMEDSLTRVSYAAGYDYAKNELGLNNDDARIHADFVAAATQSMYDRVTRNTALNSQFIRFFRPMQSYVFTALSNSLDTLGVVGRTRSVKVRAGEAFRWIMAQRAWSLLWSIALGDDLLKALLNPIFDKGTVGSNIPLFGRDIDIRISEMVPWKDDEGWKAGGAAERYVKATTRIIGAIARNDDNWERELTIYNLRYVTPMAGFGMSVPAQNLVKLISAKQNDYAFEDIKGKSYAEFYYNHPARWFSGVALGIKAVDKREKFNKPKEDED